LIASSGSNVNTQIVDSITPLVALMNVVLATGVLISTAMECVFLLAVAVAVVVVVAVAVQELQQEFHPVQCQSVQMEQIVHSISVGNVNFIIQKKKKMSE
jgi:hypothetical protein